MALTQDNEYRWSMPPDPDSPYAAAVAMLKVFSVGDPINAPTLPPQQCSIQAALSMQEQDSLTAMNDPRVGAAAQQIVDVQKRNAIRGVIDRSKLSEQDRAIYDRASPMASKGIQAMDNINAVEQLKMLATAIDIDYQASLHDLDQSAGDLDAMGTTLRQMKAQNKIDDRMLARLGAWSTLDSKYPSEQAKQLQAMPKQ
jgi:hypothetical protein